MKTLIRTALTAAALATAAAACSASVAPRASAPLDLSDVKLVSYSSCDDMLSGLRENTAKNVSSWGLGGPPIMYMERSDVAGKAVPQSTADGKGAEHSTTNVHEQGVDEPDLVKTDGKRVITVSHGKLRVIDAATKKVTGTLELAKENWVAGDLLVSGDRALVLFNGGGIPFGAVAKRAFAPTGGPQYVLVDLSGEPKLLGTIEPNGMHVDARLVGSTVRLVVRSQPDITFPQPREDVPEAERIKVNQAVVRQAPISAWLPKFTITDAAGRSRAEAVKCEQVSHPDEYTGTSLLTVHSIDLTQDLAASAANPIAVAADGDTVYGTGTSLYVTSNPRWWFPVPIEPIPVADTPVPSATESGSGTSAPSDAPSNAPSDAPSATASAPPASADTSTSSSGSVLAPIDEPTPAGTAAPPTSPAVPPEETEVHRFDISRPGAPKYVASGKVPGRLLNQYAMSEYEGNLRVATTTADQKTSSSGVYVLRADTLAKIGEVGGLGRNERIYSVRFIGPVGYVVTFRQVDPLYTLDLRDPAAPKVTGELKITGYSAYLHPAGEGRLIGLGQEASEKGRTLGTQVSLFDVSDPANPRRLSQLFQKDSGSEAEWDPHAFLYWPKTGTAVIPVSSYKNGESESGAMVLKITDSGVSAAGTIKHPRVKEGDYTYEPNIQRSVVIGDSLWTVSPSGIKVNDLNTLNEQAWIPLT